MVLIEKAKQLAAAGSRKVHFLVASQDRWTDLTEAMIDHKAKDWAIRRKLQRGRESAGKPAREIADSIVKQQLRFDRERNKVKIQDSTEHFLFMDIRRQLRGEKNIDVEFVYMTEVGQRVAALMKEGCHVILDEFGCYYEWDYDPGWFTADHMSKVVKTYYQSRHISECF